MTKIEQEWRANIIPIVEKSIQRQKQIIDTNIETIKKLQDDNNSIRKCMKQNISLLQHNGKLEGSTA